MKNSIMTKKALPKGSDAFVFSPAALLKVADNSLETISASFDACC